MDNFIALYLYADKTIHELWNKSVQKIVFEIQNDCNRLRYQGAHVDTSHNYIMCTNNIVYCQSHFKISTDDIEFV